MEVKTGKPAPLIYDPPGDPFLSVLYRDDHFIILDKPSGLLTVPGKAPEHADCLEARARTVFPTVRIVHRLDMSTSGVIVLALTAEAHRHIGLQFEKRMTRKAYIARVAGQPEAERGEVDLPLICDWPNRPKQMVDFERGKSARTLWEVLEREDMGARLRLTPITGRSHQLRVHMMSLGHPILGDELYAPPEICAAAPRLQLHAAKLAFRHPDGGEPCEFEAPCPF